MKKVCIILMFAILVSSLILGGCQPSTPTPSPAPTPTPSPAPTPAEPIKIGALLSLTGPEANLGPANMEGIKMAFDEAGWQVAGRPIEFIPEDEAFDPAKALEKAKKLLQTVNAEIKDFSGDLLALRQQQNNDFLLAQLP